MQALLFDLDGTLAHTAPDLADGINAMLASFSRAPLSEALLATMIGSGSKMLVQRALQHAGDELPEPAQLERAHHRFLQHYRAGFCRRSQCYPHVPETLQALREQGLPLAVVTNKPEQFVAPLLKYLKLDEYFSVLIGGDTLACKKPDALPLLHACEAMNVSPEQSLMVGDSITDILAARAAGMPIAAVTFGYNHGEPVSLQHPDFLIDHFPEILDIPSLSNRFSRRAK
ncbi:phosphoglycolate phosphatase [Permianibacter aggregans]|uniref:Phosphoglycolate phosphatase n=1 Tax=Permianibacter aggregans TaxID=1510150 RepID=A0A4R6UR14_9GAMM|nr:phosphoglycolate phosphatase [Permianibacter aggregans]TDQ47715.1 phosphoglycolate phosphatase [Permianibacter aggregans]